MTAQPENAAEYPPEDPVVSSGRREAIFTLGLWAAATVYTVSYCTLHGYGRDPQVLRFVLWFPDWVFWGIVAPWLVCASVSIWFALCVMQDAPLISGSDAAYLTTTGLTTTCPTIMQPTNIRRRPGGAAVNDSSVTVGYGALVALLLVIAVSVWIGTQAQKVVARSSFLTGYFLGNRGLGAWALALTATVQSGGTFMGYPSLIYSHGWVVGLWIASYMLVPLSGFAVLGKRFGQLSHRTGAITVPDLFRARFASPRLGLIASLLIIVMMSFLMIAQFKAGAIVMKLAWPNSGSLTLAEDFPEATNPADEPAVPHDALQHGATQATAKPGEAAKPNGVDTAYLVGLAIFSLTVVGYTMIGGFLASVWTDMFQSVLMAVGVVVLFCLVVPGVSQSDSGQGAKEQIAGELDSRETGDWGRATKTAVQSTGPGFASGPGFSTSTGREFLPPTLALSYFVVWVFGGIGMPTGMVRVMATKDSRTLRRSIVLLSIYNLLIYLPLLVICISARSIFPTLQSSEEVIPRLALHATRDLPAGSFIGGLILAAPFGAVMSTVSSYLVVIASGLVRDVYQHFFRPDASEAEVRRASHLAMILLGVIAVAANIHPVRYLQALVVFSAAGCAATFATPAIMLAYWRRATAAGVGSAMIAGAATTLGLLIAGLILPDQRIDQDTAFHSYYPWGYHPVIFALSASIVAGIGVSLFTAPPPDRVLSQLFDASPPPPQSVVHS